jgi:hypothetical protein
MFSRKDSFLIQKDGGGLQSSKVVIQLQARLMNIGQALFDPAERWEHVEMWIVEEEAKGLVDNREGKGECVL